LSMPITKNAESLLKQRYCLSGEKPRDVYKRVANALSLGDEKFEKQLDQAMFKQYFLPNSPCLRNAGTKEAVLHACFVLPIEDSIESIFDTVKRMAIIFHYGGGVGINYSSLRPKNAPLSSGGTSSGALSFIEVFDMVTNAVKQGGFRRGASLGILDYSHPEIIEFVRSKLTGNLTNFNISVMVDDEFMNKVINGNGDSIDLVNPNDGSVWGNIKAKNLLDLISFCSWSSGDPGLLFFDRINKDNPYYPKLKIKACNPCQPKNALLLDGDRLLPISTNKASTWISWKTGIKEVIELVCNNGMRLRFTPDHKIMLEDGSFTEAKNTLGKNLMYDLITRKVTYTKHDYAKDNILQGFLFGDGCLCANKKGVAVKLNRNKEPEVAGLLESYGFKKEASGAYYIGKEKLHVNTDFLSKRVFERDLPEDILYGDSVTVAAFLSGLFEANGSVSTIGQISLKSTCKKMIEKVQILLYSFGIPSWIIVNKPTKVRWHNGVYTSRQSYNLQISPSNAYKFQTVIGFFSNKKAAKITNTNIEYKGKIKVVKINNLGKQEVWDYKMLASPNYNFCQGIVAHNCGESPLLDYLACCLGSINLSRLVKNNSFDFNKFRKYLRLATRALLNMNAVSAYPLPQITKMMKKHNPVGVGIMGFADCLIKLSIYYDSQECLNFIDEIGKIYKEETEAMAKDSFYKRIIAPTGSLSILADCSSGIEPLFETIFERHLTIGIITETREIYKSKYVRTAHQIDPIWHLKVQAQWQKWLDGAASKTINLPYEASVDDIKDIYINAWKMGVKGVTVFRNGCKEGVLKTVTSGRNKCDGASCHL